MKYNFGRREITRIRKYLLHEALLDSHEAAAMLGVLREAEKQYTQHLTKLANERNREYKVNWQRGKTARDRLRLETTLKGLKNI